MDIKEEIELLSFIKNDTSNRSAKLFNLYLSGSDLYGWRSEDSDIDVRGCYVLDKEVVLGLNTPKPTCRPHGFKENYDIELFEIKHMINLALKGNCNILDELNAPQIYKTADYMTLKRLINNSFGKRGVYNSYRGMAKFNYKKFILQGRNTVKKYLYVFRGLMAGCYVLQTGQIEPDMSKLIKHYKVPEVCQVLEIKQAGQENEPLRDIEDGTLDELIKEWFDRIDNAYERSKLPEHPDKKDVEAVEKFLIQLRLRED